MLLSLCGLGFQFPAVAVVITFRWFSFLYTSPCHVLPLAGNKRREVFLYLSPVWKDLHYTASANYAHSSGMQTTHFNITFIWKNTLTWKYMHFSIMNRFPCIDIDNFYCNRGSLPCMFYALIYSCKGFRMKKCFRISFPPPVPGQWWCQIMRGFLFCSFCET